MAVVLDSHVTHFPIKNGGKSHLILFQEFLATKESFLCIHYNCKVLIVSNVCRNMIKLEYSVGICSF